MVLEMWPAPSTSTQPTRPPGHLLRGDLQANEPPLDPTVLIRLKIGGHFPPGLDSPYVNFLVAPKLSTVQKKKLRHRRPGLVTAKRQWPPSFLFCSFVI